MNKKKAIKIATASAIAASGFVAVAPAQAAVKTTNVNTVVNTAISKMAAAYDGYHKPGLQGKIPATAKIRQLTTNAEAAYDAAVAAIAKDGGTKSQKAAFTKKLNAKKYLLTRAQGYVKAIDVNLNAAKKTLDKAVASGKAKDVKAAEAALVKTAATFKKTVDGVYGPGTRKVLVAKYHVPALEKAATVKDELTVYNAYKQIEDGNLIEKDIAKAGTIIDATKPTVEKLRSGNKRDTKLVKNLLDAVDKNNAKYYGEIGPVESITAINATTVEVTYKNAVKDVNAIKYSIEGLTVTNAAVKQTDSKTVILTTSSQEGAKEYTIKSGAVKVGTFKGISAVVPTSIKLVSTSAQSQVGKEVTLKADIGQKAAGVAVTFNVDAPTGSLNKDQVVEAYTNADGIATYSYTQYSAGVDTVAVYPTGAPTVRGFATVYWGVQPILSVESIDAVGNTLANGSAKTYKVTYRNPVTGVPMAGEKVNVTFAENINVTSDKLSTAVVKDLTNATAGVNPYQLTSGDVKAATVTTDKNGIATFTVTGTNTAATPIVFADTVVNGLGNGKWDSTELFATTEKVTFTGAQVSNKFTLTATGSAQAAIVDGSEDNGRVYKVVVTDKDGKPYAGGVVNLALNETIDKEISTKSDAFFTTNDDLEGTLLTGIKDAAKQIKLNAKGEGEFILASNVVNDYGTPVIWIDQNVAENNQSGVLENGEPSIVGEKTFFEKVAVKSSELKVYKAGKAFTGTFGGGETAEFRYNALNQSGKVEASINKRVTYEVSNTSSEAILVQSAGNNDVTIEAYGKTTVKVEGTNPSVYVTSVTGNNASVSVSATGYELKDGKEVQYLGAQTAKASFSKYANADIATGTASSANTTAKTFVLTNAEGKTSLYDYSSSVYQAAGQTIDLPSFEKEIQKTGTKVSVTKATDGKLTFNILEKGTTPAKPTKPTISNVTVKGGGNVTITDVGTGITAWLAPAGTTVFTAGPTMTKLTGTSATTDTIIKAPTNTGSYKLYLVDAFGQISDASTNVVTVDNDAPTVNAAKFTIGDIASPAKDTITGASGAVSEANAKINAYRWNDANTNGIVDTGELGAAIALSDSGVGGTVAASELGDFAPGAYKFVITATDAVGNESVKAAGYAVTVTLGM